MTPNTNATTPPSTLFSPSVRSLTMGLSLATALVAFEGLSVVAALPELGRELTVPETVRYLPLVMTAYLLASGIAIAASGPLADSFGPRRLYRTGLVVFALASLGCGLSPNLWALIPLRLVQGLAGGMLIATNGAAIGLGYPPRMRARAYALASTIWGVLGVGGPAIAGLMLTTLSWRWIFWINTPLALIALAIGWNTIPGPAAGAQKQTLDRVGILLLSLLAAAAVTGLSDFSWVSLLALVATAMLFIGFHRHSGRDREGKPPVLRRRHYAEMPFRGLALAAALAIGAGVGVENYLPLYLREARGTSVALAAWSVLFLTIGWTSAANTASRLYDRISEARVAQLGTATLPVSIAFATLAIWQGWSLGWLFAAYFLMGAGIGSTTNACLSLTQDAAIATEIGRATSAHQFLRNMALTYGTAALGTIVLAWNPVLGAADPHAVATAVATSDTATLLTRGYIVAHLVAMVVALAAVAAATSIVRYQGLQSARTPPPVRS